MLAELRQHLIEMVRVNIGLAQLHAALAPRQCATS
jgi:hypothetical protein